MLYIVLEFADEAWQAIHRYVLGIFSSQPFYQPRTRVPSSELSAFFTPSGLQPRIDKVGWIAAAGVEAEMLFRPWSGLEAGREINQ